MSNVKYFKVGTVQNKKDKTGKTLKVGNPEAKNEKYRTNVEIIVRDSDGNVLAKAENGYLVIQDPRNRKDITEDQLARIPDFVTSEVFLVVSE